MQQITIIAIMLITSAPAVFAVRRNVGLRVKYGQEDKAGKYPYVVALVREYNRVCTGSLLNPEWVVTAAHCIYDDGGGWLPTHIQYGDMRLLPNASSTKSRIIQRELFPGYRGSRDVLSHDIALLRVLPVSLKKYGKLSAVDYISLIGARVNYAGYGLTERSDEGDTDRQTLLIGRGVVRPCFDLNSDKESAALILCVAPKCTNKYADSASGDSGGPLFTAHDSKIVGIVSTGAEPIGIYTSISPYITWISEVMGYLRKQTANNQMKES